MHPKPIKEIMIPYILESERNSEIKPEKNTNKNSIVGFAFISEIKKLSFGRLYTFNSFDFIPLL